MKFNSVITFALIMTSNVVMGQFMGTGPGNALPDPDRWRDEQRKLDRLEEGMRHNEMLKGRPYQPNSPKGVTFECSYQEKMDSSLLSVIFHNDSQNNIFLSSLTPVYTIGRKGRLVRISIGSKIGHLSGHIFAIKYNLPPGTSNTLSISLPGHLYKKAKVKIGSAFYYATPSNNAQPFQNCVASEIDTILFPLRR